MCLALVAAGCGPPPDPPVDIRCGSNVAAVTADDLFARVMDKNAPGGCANCHYPGAGAAGGDTVMNDPASLKANAGVASPHYASTLKVVDPGHPETSTVFLKCAGGSPKVKGPNGEDVGPSMPEGMAPLSAENLKLVKDWICSGAK